MGLLSLLTAVYMLSVPTYGLAMNNRVVAVVDGSPISLRDIERRSSLLALSFGKPFSEMRIYRNVALKELISETIVINKAKEFGLKLKNNNRDEIIASFLRQNNLSRERFEAALKSYQIDENELVKRLQSEVWVQNIIRSQLVQSISISELELNLELSLYKEALGKQVRRLSLIQLPITFENTLLRLSQTSKALMADLQRGVPFAKLAQQNSKHPSAANGGDLGWVHPAQVPTDIRDIVENMQPGTISPATVVNDNVYIVAYIEGKPLTVKDIPSKEQLRAQLFNRKVSLLARKKLQDWEAEAYVEIRSLDEIG